MHIWFHGKAQNSSLDIDYEEVYLCVLTTGTFNHIILSSLKEHIYKLFGGESLIWSQETWQFWYEDGADDLLDSSPKWC